MEERRLGDIEPKFLTANASAIAGMAKKSLIKVFINLHVLSHVHGSTFEGTCVLRDHINFRF